MGIGYEGTYISIYDFDKVEQENCAGGIFPESDSGTGIFKVSSIKNFIGGINSARIIAIPERYTNQPIFDEIVILCLDDIQGRLRIVNEIVQNSPNVKLIIDTRSGWHQGQVFALDTSDKRKIEKWKETLNPNVVEELPCGAKAVAYNPVTIAGYVCAILRNFFNDEEPPYEFFVLHSVPIYDIKRNIG